jgi:LmbE family N-acetylglucosaminyl deacetylase
MIRHALALMVGLCVLPHATPATRATYNALQAQQGAPLPGTFTFRDGRSRVVDLTVADIDGVPGIVWPEIVDARWHTALLGVQINADAAAVAPFVEIAAGNVSDRQYFPPGDTGERWLNLTFLLAPRSPTNIQPGEGGRGAMVGTRIALRGDGVTFAAPAAKLRLFEGAIDLNKPLLVLAPHPDDAEIGAFGLYANRNSTVVTVTAGNAGAATYESVFEDAGDQYLFKGRIRVIDSITIPWQGRVPPERAFNMGYFDARIAEMYDKREAVIPEMYRPNTDINVYRKENFGSLLPLRPRESKWENLVEDVLTVLKKVKPAVIAAPHPQLDTHRDHQYVTVALSEALARWNRPVTLLLYTNHADRNRYPYGPAGTLMSLPPPPPGDIVIDRMYSHPVTPELQRVKLFALESMHDLRFNPSRQYQLARQDARAAAPEKPGPEPDITYLRRGPRSNELFYVYERDSFNAMVKDFLSRRTPR